VLRNLRTNRVLWVLLALLALVAALFGVLHPRVYDQVVGTEVMAGVISQDVVTIAAALIMLALALWVREDGMKGQIVILGLAAYLWYGYGIYVIEQIYTVLYLLYMAVLGLSFYTMAYGVASIRTQVLQQVVLSRFVRLGSVGFSLLSPLVFYPLWISALLPLMQTGRKLEFLYSIYILDLCFIMPAFVIVAVQALRGRPLGLLLTPAMYILAMTLLFPVGIGELLKPRYGLPVDSGGLVLYLGLSAMFLILAIVYLLNLNVERTVCRRTHADRDRLPL
jgi:hypothetical protein